MKNLQPGNVVTIYQDPITQQKEEGKARLVSLYRDDHGDGLSMWEVEFLNERGSYFLRTVNANDS